MAIEEVTFVTCPQCQNQFQASITSIINVSENPAHKIAFLNGQLNQGQCPHCGFSGELEAPVLYHDQEKELAYVFSPGGFQMTQAESERIIGGLTNRLMNSLPPELRKAYLLSPKSFLTLENLKKALLEADGITEEVLQAQQDKIELLQKMLRIRDQAELQKTVKDHDAELDHQFFEILSHTAFNALSQGDEAQAQGLLSFRQLVAEWSSHGKDIIAEIDERAGFQAMTPELLLENLKNAASNEEFVNLIQAGKPLIDYAFFQNLTAQIEALTKSGNTTEAEQLKALRSRILDVSAQVEEANRQAINQALQLLQEVMQADDLNTFVSNNIARFDQTFFSILAANIQEAAGQGQEKAAQQLGDLQSKLLAIIEERVPPEFKLLNILLLADSTEQMKSMLAQNQTLLTPQFIELLDRATADFESQGQTEIVKRLRSIKTEANSLKASGSILMP